MVRVTATRAANGWSKDHIQFLLQTNNKAVERALLQIYARQTAYEKRANDTQLHNGVGFTAYDGEFLSEMAVKCERYNGLTERQLAVVRRKMMKYWKQLLEIAAQSPNPPNFEIVKSEKPKKIKERQTTLLC